MKNSLRLVGGLLLIAVLLAGLSTLTVSAQGPTGTETPTTAPSGQTPAAAPPAAAASTAKDDPATAATVGSAIPAIPVGQATWLKFNYGTNGNSFPRPQVMIRLLNGVTTGMGFEVWAPERMQPNWFDNKPTGRGVPENLPGTRCFAANGQLANIKSNGDIVDLSGNVVGNINDANPPGTRNCQTNDLLWIGGFGADGTYYIRVVNNANTAPNTVTGSTATGSNNTGVAQLIISGPGLAECQTGAFPQVAAPLQGTGTTTNQPQTAQGAQGQQVAPGQSFSVVQCQNPTQAQLVALNSSLGTTGVAQNPSAPAAAPTVAATPTEAATVAPAATTAATAVAPAATTAATAVATAAATSAATSTTAATAAATSTTTAGGAAGASTPAAAPSVSAVPTCTPTPTPATSGTSTPEPTSAVAGTATPSPTPNCVMPSSSGGASSSSSSSTSSSSATPAGTATP